MTNQKKRKGYHMKKVLISTLTLILMLGLVSCVQAASLKFTPTASTTNLKEGDEITITLNLSDIDMGEDGINSFGGKLVYDENIFEKVTTSSFSSQNNWSINRYIKAKSKEKHKKHNNKSTIYRVIISCRRHSNIRKPNYYI